MRNQTKTKIIATLGPACESREMIMKMILAGVSVFRFNTKHNNIAWHKSRIKRTLSVASSLGERVGIMIDISGSETRLTLIDQNHLTVKKGDVMCLSSVSGRSQFLVEDESFWKNTRKNDKVLIGDEVLGVITDTRSQKTYIKVTQGGVIEDRARITLSNYSKLVLDASDKETLLKLGKHADIIALSYCNSRDDIIVLKRFLSDHKFSCGIVAKIESEVGISNLTEIVEEADGIMVARGDLGVAVSDKAIAYWQKRIVNLCRQNSKSVIVATAMLQSMTLSTKPTRSEVIDVANAVFDGASSVMLSNETAIGRYPIQSVTKMAEIIEYCESKQDDVVYSKKTEIMIDAVSRIVFDHSIDIVLIVVFTSSGKTASKISALRPDVPIVAVSNIDKSKGSMFISYGVSWHESREKKAVFDLSNRDIKEIVAKYNLHKGNKILVVHGPKLLKEGSTNAMAILTI